MELNRLNFFCVGAQKAGTTSLHDTLIQHPDVYLPKTKEAHFFDVDENYEKGIDWYINTFFADYNNQKICGSCNPEYMYFERVPKRIYNTLGKDVKFIFIFRNPADRAYSHFLMSKRRCIEEFPFAKALELENERIKKDYYNNTHFSYVSRGYYVIQVKRYLKYFSKENMLFIRFEDDFIKNREETINKIISFLELEPLELNVNLKSNVARSSRFKFIQRFIYKDNFIKSFFSLFVSQKFKNVIRNWIYKIFMTQDENSKLDDDIRKHLLKIYNDDINELEEIIGKSLETWRT